MANATMAEIRAGIAANLATLDFDAQINPYALANPSPPFVQILRGDIDYDQAMRRGLDTVTVTVQAGVAMSADIGSQVKMDELTAPTGVKAAVESDKTLGGKVADVHVTSCAGDRIAPNTSTGGMTLVAEWTVLVYATN